MCFDILLALMALTILFPILLAIAIAVRLDSKGPILYGSERIGKKGRTFRCFKFRTMVPDAEKRRARDSAHERARLDSVQDHQ